MLSPDRHPEQRSDEGSRIGRRHSCTRSLGRQGSLGMTGHPRSDGDSGRSDQRVFEQTAASSALTPPATGMRMPGGRVLRDAPAVGGVTRSRRKVVGGWQARGPHNSPPSAARPAREVPLTPPLTRANLPPPGGRYAASPVNIIRGYAAGAARTALARAAGESPRTADVVERTSHSRASSIRLQRSRVRAGPALGSGPRLALALASAELRAALAAVARVVCGGCNDRDVWLGTRACEASQPPLRGGSVPQLRI